ncbi:transcriptional regulator [Serratia sp. NPDC078593]|uniref:winged helix-turn-helix domain-containing protein n=1 Tax=unclassified Serratia (in: enterobacteria) TaxID=2647522 RepID=UPI0037D635CA
MSHVIYRIEDSIIFCPKSIGFYQQSLASEHVAISAAAARLFTLLIKHKGEVVERDTILTKVWDDHGLQASNNNLNQCLSILRRIIKTMGVEKNVIETIPKVGLKIANDVLIEALSISPDGDILSRVAHTKKAQKEKKNGLVFSMFALIFLLLISVSFNVAHYYKIHRNTPFWVSKGTQINSHSSFSQHIRARLRSSFEEYS